VSNIFIAPHNDDEALFGAFTCLRYKPKIITVLRSYVESNWRPAVYFETRERESAAAAKVLGCQYEQWHFPDNTPDWQEIAGAMSKLAPERVWAPLPEEGGHPHHNAIAEIAATLWPYVVYYATYTHARGKTTTGFRVIPRPGWERRKRAAMACYVSQATHPMCAVAFSEWPIDEYLTW
jgi:LmbE family N-acetylglucosaminyl deacetylase